MAREFKDSGIEWIGQIPKEWEVAKLRNLGCFSASGIDKKIIEGEELIHIVNYVDVYNNNTKELRAGNYMVVSAPLDKCQEHQLFVGDMIYTPSSETIEDIGLSSVVMDELPNTAYSYHVIRFRTHSEICLMYKKYLTNNHVCLNYFSSCATGSIRKTLSREIFKECKVLLPPLSEQQKIADYLDKVCGEVDEMVALQETMIEELKAYKQSVITEAVTKGLNPNVSMRNSGIDWIGEIPEHWEAKKLKYIVDYIESGTSVNAGNVPAQANEYGVLKTSAVSKYVFDATENKTVVSEEMDKVSCPVRKNTIIVSRMNTPELVGACGYVEKNYDNIFLPDRLWQVHFVDTVYVKFIWYALRGSNIRNYYSSLSVGSSSSMQNISQSQFSNGSIPIPSDVEEQCAIVSYLDTKCSEIDSLIDLKQAKIEELKEYKKSVIYEYVTGKKEIV